LVQSSTKERTHRPLFYLWCSWLVTNLKMNAAALFVTILCLTLASSSKPSPNRIVPSPGQSYPPHFIRVPIVRQGTSWTCGVAATASVLNFWTGIDYQEDHLAKELHATDRDGTSYGNITHFAQTLGYKVEDRRNMTLGDLFAIIDKGTPPLMLIQAWPDEYPVDWKNDWDDGHWVVGVGYDSNNVYLMDPDTMGCFTFIALPEFQDRWHDEDTEGGERLVHFALVLSLDQPPIYNADAFLPLQ